MFNVYDIYKKARWANENSIPIVMVIFMTYMITIALANSALLMASAAILYGIVIAIFTISIPVEMRAEKRLKEYLIQLDQLTLKALWTSEDSSKVLELLRLAWDSDEWHTDVIKPTLAEIQLCEKSSENECRLLPYKLRRRLDKFFTIQETSLIGAATLFSPIYSMDVIYEPIMSIRDRMREQLP